jgi:hypothetical protein
VRDRFAALVIVDGSGLVIIACRLKLLWNERAVGLPGCLLGVYGVGFRLCHQLHFSAHAAGRRAKTVLPELASGTLVLGDQLYGTVGASAASNARRCWGVVRRNRPLRLHRLRRLRKRCVHRGVLGDWLVRAGTGVSASPQTLRYIHWRRDGARHEVLTNVLIPAGVLPRGGPRSLPTAAASSGCSLFSTPTSSTPLIPTSWPCRSMLRQSSPTLRLAQSEGRLGARADLARDVFPVVAHARPLLLESPIAGRNLSSRISLPASPACPSTPPPAAAPPSRSTIAPTADLDLGLRPARRPCKLLAHVRAHRRLPKSS